MTKIPKIILSGLFVLPAFAAQYEPVTSAYDFATAPEYQAILSTIKTYGEFEAKPVPQPETPKTMSKGEQAVEEAKARNRAKLAEMYKIEKSQEEDNRSQLEKWKAEERETLTQWKKESRDQLNAWKREQDIFLGKIKVYKENKEKIDFMVTCSHHQR